MQQLNCHLLKTLKDIITERTECQIMILAHNKTLLRYLYNGIQSQNIGTVGYYIGGMKDKDLKISETKQIIIATYAMAAEPLDIKTLSVLLMATPKTDGEQAIGRILRKKNVNALVVDIIDQHPIFQRQWKKRRQFYKKNKYIIKHSNLTTPKQTIISSLTGQCLIDD